MCQQFFSITPTTSRPLPLSYMKNIYMVTFPFIFLIIHRAQLIEILKSISDLSGSGFTNHSPPCLSVSFSSQRVIIKCLSCPSYHRSG